MTLFLALSLGLSMLVLGLAYVMDRGAIRGRVNGANGLPLAAALVVSALGSLAVAALTAIFWGWAAALGVLGFSALWHWGAAKLLIGALQRLADRVKAKA